MMVVANIHPIRRFRKENTYTVGRYLHIVEYERQVHVEVSM